MDGNYIITANGSFANEADLYHWGIKGMRWGVRRYQNADGSLTAAGRKRYYNSDGSPTSYGRAAIRERRISLSDNMEMQKKFHNSKEKKANEFSNDEYLLWDKHATKGKVYIKQLQKELLDGYVTSFTEDSKGNINVKGKTSKGIVVRDKTGSRVTSYDYDQAQRAVQRMIGHRINTGQWS